VFGVRWMDRRLHRAAVRLTDAQFAALAEHPPSGLRAQMLERHPRQPAAVTLTETEAAHIDDELAVHQKRVLRELTG
jgi:hypothetical protein